VRLLRFVALVAVLVLAALVLDSVLGDAVGSGRIDPYLMITVWFGASGRKPDGMLAGALAGLVQDAMGSVVIGTHLLSKVVVGYVVMLLASRLIPGQVVTHAVLLTVAGVLEVAVLTAAGMLVGRHLAPGPPLPVVLCLLANVAIGTMIFSLVAAARWRRERMVARGPRGR
jgi:rod shape-determining protein MreD